MDKRYLEKEEIITILADRLKDESLHLLVALKKANSPVLKEQLREMVNELSLKAKGTKLINSRYTLDISAAKLEGAGLVDIKEVGRARLYSITRLGHELIEYKQKNR